MSHLNHHRVRYSAAARASAVACRPEQPRPSASLLLPQALSPSQRGGSGQGQPHQWPRGCQCAQPGCRAIAGDAPVLSGCFGIGAPVNDYLLVLGFYELQSRITLHGGV